MLWPSCLIDPEPFLPKLEELIACLVVCKAAPRTARQRRADIGGGRNPSQVGRRPVCATWHMPFLVVRSSCLAGLRVCVSVLSYLLVPVHIGPLTPVHPPAWLIRRGRYSCPNLLVSCDCMSVSDAKRPLQDLWSIRSLEPSHEPTGITRHYMTNLNLYPLRSTIFDFTALTC